MKKLSIFAVLLNSLAFAGTFSISPTPQFVVPAQKITFTTTASGNTYTWSISTNPGSAVSSSGSTVDYTVPSLDPCTQITITATKAGSGGASEETESLTLVVAAPGSTAPLEPCAGGNVSFGIIGLEQSGGASVKSTQRLFIDIFDSRPLPFGSKDSSAGGMFGPSTRWWGTVRIASYPQQISSALSSLDIAGSVGKLPVNQIAGYGEFRAGLEHRVAAFNKAFLPTQSGNSERTSLGLIGYFGGAASLSAPTETVQVFTKPDATTPQGQAFYGQFPLSQYPILNQAKYIGLTAPDHKSLYWQYAAGARLTTRFFDSTGKSILAPAMFSASFGQNELVTGGRRRGVVGVFEGFLPLPLAANNTIYFFGRVDLRLGRANLGSTPIALAPALDSSGNPIPVTDPGVAIIAVPSNRDLYSIGVGLDAIGVINSIFKKP